METARPVQRWPLLGGGVRPQGAQRGRDCRRAFRNRERHPVLAFEALDFQTLYQPGSRPEEVGGSRFSQPHVRALRFEEPAVDRRLVPGTPEDVRALILEGTCSRRLRARRLQVPSLRITARQKQPPACASREAVGRESRQSFRSLEHPHGVRPLPPMDPQQEECQR